MKNKYTNEEVARACNIVIQELQNLAEFTANKKIESDCNQARIIVKDLLDVVYTRTSNRVWSCSSF